MIRHRTHDEVYRYDLFKLIVALFLAALLIILAIRGCVGGTPIASIDAPVLTQPQSGAELAPGMTALVGTATAGTGIRVLADGIELGTTTADETGAWSFDTDLAAGEHNFTFEAIDMDGNVAATSPAYRLAVVETAVEIAEPSIDLPDGDIRAGAYTLTGTGEPGYDVAIVIDGEEVGTTTVGADGTWAFDTELAAGAPAVAVRTLSAEGEALNEYGELSLSVIDVVKPSIALPAAGLAAGALTLSGTGMPDTDLELFANGASLGTTRVGADGSWSLDTELDAGSYELSARSLDMDGNLLAESDGFALDLNAPELAEFQAPEISLPSFSLPAFGLASGLFALNGIATPNADVELVADGDVVATTTADADGNWFSNLNLEPGRYAVSARSLDADGSVSGESEPVELDLGVRAPTFDLPTLSLPDAPSLGDVDLPEFSLPKGAFAWTGKGEPGSRVGIVVDDVTVDTVDVDENGSWSYDASFDPGAYLVKLQALDADGNVLGESRTATFNVVDQTFPTVASQEEAADAGTLTLSGTAEPNATLEIAVDGRPIGTVDTDADGNWTLDTDLDSGSYFVQARTLDADGNVALVSLPAIYRVGDGSGNILITDVSGGGFSTEPVTITGLAEPNSEVTLTVDGMELAPVTADADGTFSYTGYFPGGEHVAMATAVGSAEATTDVETPFAVGLQPAVADTVDEGNGALRVLFFSPKEADGAVASGAISRLGQSAVSVPATELVLDASWSMTLDQSGDNRLTADNPDSRIAIAKDALTSIINESIPEGAPIALRAFGNIEGNLSCRTDLMVPLQPLNRESFDGVINGVVPQFNANTAIANSLAQIANDLDTERPKIVVLLTDGEETCGGDPAAVIEGLKDQGVDVKVNVIGFAINNEEIAAEFQRWADLGDGTYYDAANFDDLVAALSDSLTVSYDVLDEAGDVVASGQVGGTAVELPAGHYSVAFGGESDAAYQNVVVTEGGLVRLLSN